MRDAAGYTLVEAIAALSLLLVAGSLTGLLYLRAVELQERWKARTAMENRAHLTAHRLLRDLRMGASLQVRSDSIWQIIQQEEHVLYEWTGDSLYRNGRVLARVTQVRYDSTALQFSIRFFSGTDSLELPIRAASRVPEKWPPITR